MLYTIINIRGVDRSYGDDLVVMDKVSGVHFHVSKVLHRSSNFNQLNLNNSEWKLIEAPDFYTDDDIINTSNIDSYVIKEYIVSNNIVLSNMYKGLYENNVPKKRRKINVVAENETHIQIIHFCDIYDAWRFKILKKSEYLIYDLDEYPEYAF